MVSAIRGPDILTLLTRKRPYRLQKNVDLKQPFEVLFELLVRSFFLPTTRRFFPLAVEPCHYINSTLITERIFLLWSKHIAYSFFRWSRFQLHRGCGGPTLSFKFSSILHNISDKNGCCFFSRKKSTNTTSAPTNSIRFSRNLAFLYTSWMSESNLPWLIWYPIKLWM